MFVLCPCRLPTSVQAAAPQVWDDEISFADMETDELNEKSKEQINPSSFDQDIDQIPYFPVDSDDEFLSPYPDLPATPAEIAPELETQAGQTGDNFLNNNDIANPQAKTIPPVFLNQNGQEKMLESVNLEDADIRPVLLNYMEQNGINFMIEPNINCRVSLSFHDVSLWTTLQNILSSCGLGYKITDDIVQVNTHEALAADKKLKQLITGGPYFLNHLNALEVKKMLSSDTGDNSGLLSNPDTVSEPPSVVADEATNSIIIRDEADNVEKILALLTEMDKPSAQIRVQTWIIETNSTTAQEIGVRWGARVKMGDTYLFGRSRKFYDSGEPDNPDFSLGGNSDLYSMGMGVFNDNIRLGAELEALESEGKLTVLSRPEVILQNHKEATIAAGSEIWVSVYQNEQNDLRMIDATMRVTVRPHITRAGYIMLAVTVDDRQPNFSNRTSDIPEIIAKTVQTELLVYNGKTVVLGGLRKNRASNDNDGVPVLKDVPVLGSLFKYKSSSSRDEELVIIIRPTIIPYDNQGNQINSSLAGQVNR
jgi:type IV pilus assembly protein PilQ